MYPAVTHQSHRNTGRWDLKVCLGNECWGVFIEAPMVAKHGMTSLTSSKVGVLNRSVEPWYQWDHHIIWFIKRHVSKMLVIHGEFGNLLRYFGLGLFCVIWCFFANRAVVGATLGQGFLVWVLFGMGQLSMVGRENPWFGGFIESKIWTLFWEFRTEPNSAPIRGGKSFMAALKN